MWEILLTAATATAVPGQSSDPVQQYINCAGDEALALEPSGEPATTIAEVAVSKCERGLKGAADSLQAELLARPEIQEYRKNYAIPLQKIRSDDEAKLHKAASSLALRVVVDKRAKKVNNAPNR